MVVARNNKKERKGKVFWWLHIANLKIINLYIIKASHITSSAVKLHEVKIIR